MMGKVIFLCLYVTRVSEVSQGSQDRQAFQDSQALKVRLDPEERR